MSRYDDPDRLVSAAPGDAGWLAVFVINAPDRAPVCNVFRHDTQAQARGQITRILRELSDGSRPHFQAFARPLLTPEMFGTLPEEPLP